MKRVLLFALIYVSIASRSFAGGMTLHMNMSDVALQEVSDPELKKILNDNREAVMAGTVFPDTGNGLNYTIGYSKQDNYAKLTHYHPFLEAYLGYIKTNCRAPYSGHCQELIAHFMGSAAHNIEDGTSHYILYRIDERMDPAGERTDMDSAGDFVLIQKYGRGKDLPRYVVPYDDLVRIFRSMGVVYSRRSLVDGNRIHRLALFAERAMAPARFQTVKRRNPWFVDNIMTAPGGVNYGGRVTAQYWDALWERLNGKDPAGMISAVYPDPDARDIDPATALYLMFNRPMQGETINTDTVILKDGNGDMVNASIKINADSSRLTVFAVLNPAERLRGGQEYSAVLSPEITDLNGRRLEAYVWKFTTAAAGD